MRRSDESKVLLLEARILEFEMMAQTFTTMLELSDLLLDDLPETPENTRAREMVERARGCLQRTMHKKELTKG